MVQTDIEAYFTDGCGRCEHFQTAQCKVVVWADTLAALREVLRASPLTEDIKWGSPCYTFDGGKVLMLTALRDRCALGFFKGTLLHDEHDVLQAPGPNSQAVRQLVFTSAEQVRERRDQIDHFLSQAIDLQRAGAKVVFDPAPEPMPDELQAVLDADPAVATAFDALTPGRRRSYVLHVSRAKQAKTRTSRATRCIPKILQGKGFHDR